ncbi:hypothetical protein ScPMuIL_004259 [Solemya velum]
MGKDKGLIGKETFQRLNFLYQAAHLCLTSTPSDLNLCRLYVHDLKSIAKKSVLRVHFAIKRTICKKCDMLLVPGITAIVRNRSKREKHTVVTCLDCGQVKRFLWRKGHKLWMENPEAWLADTK